MKRIRRITSFKKHRIALGLSQGDLAERLGMAISSIGGFERGENPISESIALRIAEILGRSRDVLFVPHKKLKNKWLAR